MLRRPDSEIGPRRFRPARRRVLQVIMLIALGMLASAQLSPIGVLIGLLAGSVIIVFGLATGWVVTYILKIPRDGRGVHERGLTPDQSGE